MENSINLLLKRETILIFSSILKGLCIFDTLYNINLNFSTFFHKKRLFINKPNLF